MTKEDVLALLEKSDAPVSGEQMCKALGKTRAGIWKAIEALRADGFHIEAAPRSGSRRPRMPPGHCFRAFIHRFLLDERSSVRCLHRLHQ